MKQKISYNSLWSGLAITYFVVFIAIFVLCWVFISQPFDNVFFWIFFGLFCLGILWACCSMPSSVYADDDYLEEGRAIGSKRYNYSDIQSAKVATDDEYARADRGKHFHGKYKNPVLITFKDGRTMVIGSEDAQKLVDFINTKLS